MNQVRLEIHRTHQDAERRKCNVVITGFPEPNTENVNINNVKDDKEVDNVAFSKFCDEHHYEASTDTKWMYALRETYRTMPLTFIGPSDFGI